MTAVSVRRIVPPRDASANPAECAPEISPSVHPPSGPIASAAEAGPGAPASLLARTSRKPGALERSERKIFRAAADPAKASPGAAASRSEGGRSRRDCCADSTKIFRQRSRRFCAAARSGLSLRAAASGTISATPSSVAFSSAHSNRSNFTIESSRWMAGAGSLASRGSRSENSIRGSERLSAAIRSIRPKKTRWPSDSSYSWPGSARRTRPRCSAASPVNEADDSSKRST